MRLFTYKSITWEQFKNRYLWREDGYLYEWVNGCVVRTKQFENYKKWLQLGAKSSLNNNIGLISLIIFHRTCFARVCYFGE